MRRALPIREHRLVGPWCFLDRFGPLSFTAGKPMDVAPHPHIGLQTVSWLLEGEIAHDDSLGSASLLRPGGVNVMTSGDGIAHAEQTPRDHTGRLNGVQLWTALPDAVRRGAAGVRPRRRGADRGAPGRRRAGVRRRAVRGVGSFSRTSRRWSAPTCRCTPGARWTCRSIRGSSTRCWSWKATPRSTGSRSPATRCTTWAARASSLELSSRAGARVLLIGGPPFGETILMWWNFVARTPEELAQARADWEARQRFGEVAAYRGARLDAPPLSRVVRPNPVS